MTGTGLSSQVGYKIESTAGTRAVPDKFLELISENVTIDPNWITLAGMRAGRRTQRAKRVAGHTYGGGITVPLSQHTIGGLFRSLMGGVSTTGSGPYTHVFTPGAATDDTLTLQIGRPRAASTTVDPIDLLGCSIISASLTANATDTAEQAITFGIAAMSHSTAQTLASASYTSGLAGFIWTELSLSVGGSARSIDSLSLNLSRTMRTNYKTIRGTNPGLNELARDNGLMSLTGSLQCDYDATTLRDAVLAGTELALSAVYSNGTHSITFAGNIQPTGGETNVAGPDILKQPFNFEFVHASADSSALTITLVNGDSTP